MQPFWFGNLGNGSRGLRWSGLEALSVFAVWLSKLTNYSHAWSLVSIWHMSKWACCSLYFCAIPPPRCGGSLTAWRVCGAPPREPPQGRMTEKAGNRKHLLLIQAWRKTTSLLNPLCEVTLFCCYHMLGVACVCVWCVCVCVVCDFAGFGWVISHADPPNLQVLPLVLSGQ